MSFSLIGLTLIGPPSPSLELNYSRTFVTVLPIFHEAKFVAVESNNAKFCRKVRIKIRILLHLPRRLQLVCNHTYLFQTLLCGLLEASLHCLQFSYYSRSKKEHLIHFGSGSKWYRTLLIYINVHHI